MSKIIRNLSVFMLWLAGIIFCAHLIISHDHHSSGSFSGQNENCPLSDQRHDHNPRFPAHCHAFNDLISEKLSPLKLLTVIQHNFITLVNTFAESPHKILKFCVIAESPDNSLPYPFISGSLLLRAPPFLA